MSWGFPIMRCSCGAVGKPLLTPGPSAHTWRASCAACGVFLKVVPRLGEPEATTGEVSSGARLYDKRDLPQAALRELARRKLKALGLDPDVPRPHKHVDE